MGVIVTDCQKSVTDNRETFLEWLELLEGTKLSSLRWISWPLVMRESKAVRERTGWGTWHQFKEP